MATSARTSAIGTNRPSRSALRERRGGRRRTRPRAFLGNSNGVTEKDDDGSGDDDGGLLYGMLDAARRAMASVSGEGVGTSNAGSEGRRFGLDETAAPTWESLAERCARIGGEEDVDADVADARAMERLFGTTTAPRVKFYRDHASWCPYSQKIWMQLEEKRIPYTLEKINMRCYGPKPTSFTSKVPSGALPVIELDGRVITESSIITQVLEQEFPEHESLLPYAPGSPEAQRATRLMRLERALFSSWMQWITSSWSDASGQSSFSEVLDEVDAELGAGGGPYFMGEEFTLVDIAYTPFLERMAASVLYFKGVKIEGNGGRWPHLDRWYAAMFTRKVYRGIKSDYYTTAHDLPPQLGGCAENGDNVQARDAIDGVDGTSWRLPLGPLDGTSLEPWWGEDDPKAARIEAARRIIGNHANVARFAARGCGKEGRPAYSAPLSDPNAVPGEEHIPAVDAALRMVVAALLSDDAGDSASIATREGSYDAAATTRSLAYLRDRIGVPRDMSYPAARQFRAHLNWAIDGIARAS